MFLFSLAGYSIPWTAKILGIILGIAAIFLGIRIVQKLEQRRWWDLQWEDLIPVFTLGLYREYLVWMVGGLENSLSRGPGIRLRASESCLALSGGTLQRRRAL